MKLKRSHALVLFFLLLAFYVYFYKINNILEKMSSMYRHAPYSNCSRGKCYQMCQNDETCLQGHDECVGCNIERTKSSTYNPVVISNTQTLETNTPLLKKLSPSVIIVNNNPNQEQVPIIQNHDPMFAPQRTTGMLSDSNVYN